MSGQPALPAPCTQETGAQMVVDGAAGPAAPFLFPFDGLGVVRIRLLRLTDEGDS